ncbi:hypothetical protein FKP32DRAFT_1617984 [Trametes sanguinea]|nr:hypothetical protein FKP32DRAFT_1617984 [Trametes sanguinea]
MAEPRPDALRAEGLRGPYYSTTPAPHFSEADSSASLSRKNLLDLERQRYAEVIALRSLLNSGTTINQLPNELLVKIFMHVRCEDLLIFSWLNLLLVCRHWFYLVATTASFWRCLLVTYSTKLLRTGLARSKGTLVDVSLPIAPVSEDLFSEILTLIEPHIHRLRSLDLVCAIPEATLRLCNFIDSHSIPRLRVLKLWHASADGEILQLPLSAQRLPDLQTVSTHGFNILSSPSLFPQLRVVEVSSSFGTTLEVAALIKMVRNLDNIETLHLSGLISRVSAEDAVIDVAPPTDHKVTLHKLRYLTMFLKASITRQLLGNIIVPSTSRVLLNALNALDQIDPPSIMELLPLDKTVCLPVLSQLVSATVTINGWSEEVAVRGRTAPLTHEQLISQDSAILFCTAQTDTTAWGEAAIHVMDPLRAIEDAVKLQALKIMCNPLSKLDAAWEACFLAHPMLRELTVTVYYDEPNVDGAEHIIQRLDPGPSDEQIAGVGSVPIPDLMFLRLRGPWRITETLLATTKACLENRRRMLGKQQVLAELLVECCESLDTDAFTRDKEAFEKEMSPLVGLVVYSMLGVSSLCSPDGFAS